MKRISAPILLFLFSLSVFAQSAGKIYTASEAFDLYGNVTYSRPLDANFVKYLLDKTDNKIMFAFSKNRLIVCGDKREVIYSDNSASPSADEVLRVFDRDVFIKFLQLGSSNVIDIELRGDVLTLSAGNYTLEFSYPCPPFCD